MKRHAAFLRAVNVGGRTVTGEQLVAPLVALGFERVSTFLASGNIVFDADGRPGELERRIERAYADALGFDVDTFVRTGRQLAALGAADPFPDAPLGDGHTLHVVFLKASPARAAKRTIAAVSSDHDRLHLAGREIWWRIDGGLMASTLDWKPIERALAQGATTVRNINTVRRLVAKLDAG